MTKQFLSVAVAAASLVAMPAMAQTVVNFDQSDDETSYTSQGLVLNGFTILSNTFGGAVDVPSNPNYANVDANGSTFTFVDPTTGAATTASNFGVTVPGLNAGGGFYAGGTLTFLGLGGGVLGMQSFAPVGPNEGLSDRMYSNNLTGIASVVFTRTENPSGPALFPIDDVRFTLESVAGGIPEPATWAMMIGGFGMVGGALRRRPRTAVRFAA